MAVCRTDFTDLELSYPDLPCPDLPYPDLPYMA